MSRITISAYDYIQGANGFVSALEYCQTLMERGQWLITMMQMCDDSSLIVLLKQEMPGKWDWSSEATIREDVKLVLNDIVTKLSVSTKKTTC